MSRRALLLFLGLALFWGIPYLLIKYALLSFTPATLVMLRTLIGGLVLLPLALREKAFPAVARHWPAVLVYTLVEIVIPWPALSHAEQVIPSGLAALLISAVPVVGVLLGLATRRQEHLGRSGIAGLMLGLGGVGLLVGHHSISPQQPGTGLALLEMAAVVLGYAAGPLIIHRWLRDVPSSGIIVVSLLVPALLLTPLAVAQWPTRIESSAVIAVILLGLISTALAFLALFALVREVGAVRATVVTYLNPAVAIIVGAIFLKEPITATTLAGFVAVVGGSVLVHRRPAAATDNAGNVQATATPDPGHPNPQA
ncbi:DMT family transporter [Austwickia chelonae]|uniref:DMT family transporter n=1 Tax=Austwickia chelonae TaxID=100225 RepID=UPI0013C30E35|nr:DMT family transporter [Austwickia chelonae]